MRICWFALLSGIASVALTGCETPVPPQPSTEARAENDEHSHEGGHAHGAGPHGGTVTDWGGGAYHIEFTVDHDRQEATVYILGSDEQTPAPLKTDKITLVINEPETEIELVASPLEGETTDQASRFVGKHETLGIVREFSGTIQGVVEGTPYTGDFSEKAHGANHEH